LEDFYRRAGVADKIRYFDHFVFMDAKRRRGTIKPSRLPAPFHLVPSFVTFPLLSLKDKLSIARAMLHVLRSSGNPRLKDGMSMLDWLRRQKQTPAAIDRFWRVVLVSALNEDLERTDAHYGIMVFWKAFLSSASAYGIGVPAVPLADLYASCAENVEVRTRCTAGEVCIVDGRVTGVRLEGGGEVAADYYLLAVHFDRLLKVIQAH